VDGPVARKLLVGCFRAGLAAVDPEEAVAGAIGGRPGSSRGASPHRRSGAYGGAGSPERAIRTSLLRPIDGRVVVLALGKAAPAMARGVARALRRDRLEGIVVSNHPSEVPEGLELLIGSHPVPDEASLEAGRALLESAGSLGAEDTALVLISGGGSALAEVLVPGVEIADLAEINRALLRSGADITATNIVRRRLSKLKGGGLADAIAPARLITLIVSDVVGDDPATIASGPTVAPAEGEGAAIDVVTGLGMLDSLDPAVVEALRRPLAHRGSPEQELHIVAGGATAAHAAAAEAERLGIPARVLDTRMSGDAGLMAGEALDRAAFGLSVFAGETTVDVTGDGVGGRNHEAGLVAATLIQGRSDVWFLAAGTDGIDGMTPAAGVVVDGGTIARATAAGLDANRALERNDSGTFFGKIGEQIVTGATGTNVGDLWLVLRD